jgi:hypothetical protein
MLVDPNLRTPYVADWSIDLQRALGGHLSLDVGYVGNHGTKLISALEINQPIAVTANVAGVGLTTFGPGYTALGLATCASAPTPAACKPSAANEQAARPYNTQYPYLRFIDDYGNIDNSNYNGLQAVLTARNFHGLTLTTGYTYSHALAINSGQGTGGSNVLPLNSYGDLHAQLYAPTTFDVRHRLTISGTYTIPGRKGFAQLLEGWSINGATIIQTGAPWHLTDTTTDFSGTGEQTGNSSTNEASQWDFFGNPTDFTPHRNFYGVTPGPSIGLQGAAPGIPYFPGKTNAACLTASQGMGPLAVASLTNLGCYALGSSVLVPPPYGGYGTSQYNLWRDQGFRNVDMSISKAFKIKERLTAQFRVEVFNILNHTNFVNPFGGPGGGGGSLNPSRAGQSSGGPGPGLAFVSNTPDQAGSNPVLGSGGARDLQLGMKLIF